MCLKSQILSSHIKLLDGMDMNGKLLLSESVISVVYFFQFRKFLIYFILCANKPDHFKKLGIFSRLHNQNTIYHVKPLILLLNTRSIKNK